VSELLQAFLEDFLETSGYHDIGAAVADTLAAFEASRVPTRVAGLATPTESASAAI
jgi:hypothetical protein